MDAFKWISVVLSMILGLGVTRLLAATVAVFRSRKRAQLDWVPLAWAGCIFLWQLQYWWAIIELPGMIQSWTIGSFLMLVSLTLLLFDHGRTSRWTHYVVEEEKVKLAWEAVERIGVARREEHSAEHKFRDHAELLAKVKVHGEVAIQRIERFRDRTAITIPLTYEIALVKFAPVTP